MLVCGSVVFALMVFGVVEQLLPNCGARPHDGHRDSAGSKHGTVRSVRMKERKKEDWERDRRKKN